MGVRYFIEGPDEKTLIKALQVPPAKEAPGKIDVFNVVQNEIKFSEIAKLDEDTVVFVCDTDAGNQNVLQKNISLVSSYKKLILWRQVRNLEEMLVRATDIKDVRTLTKSKTKREFKSDFRCMERSYLRKKLEEHKIDINKLWDITAIT